MDEPIIVMWLFVIFILPVICIPIVLAAVAAVDWMDMQS